MVQPWYKTCRNYVRYGLNGEFIPCIFDLMETVDTIYRVVGFPIDLESLGLWFESLRVRQYHLFTMSIVSI
jgi:hypothetical protein